MISRRTFIGQSGILSAAMLLKPVFSHAANPSKRIGLQLYSLRNEIGKDVPGVLAKVADAGYTDVETYGYTQKDKFWKVEPRALAKMLKSVGLTSYSGHYGMEGSLRKGGTDEELKAAIDAAAIIGQRYVVIPHVSGNTLRTLDDYKALAERMNVAAMLCKRSGLKLGYHNHDVELKPINGTRGYDLLLEGTDPELVKFELDLYWAVRAGTNPIELFKKYPGRFVMWHIKDMDKAKPNLNTEVGSGSINYKEIFTYARLSGLQQAFVEQENFSIDPYASIRQSADYIKANFKK